MMTLFVHNSKTDIRTACEVKHAPMHWHMAGVWQTKTGYGKRIATANMVKFNGACGENLIIRDY